MKYMKNMEKNKKPGTRQIPFLFFSTFIYFMSFMVKTPVVFFLFFSTFNTFMPFPDQINVSGL